MHTSSFSPGSLVFASLLALALPSTTHAAPTEGKASGSLSLGGAKGDASAGGEGEIVAVEEGEGDAEQRPWIRRYTPRRNMWEVGFFGGVWLPADNIELHDNNLPPPIRYDTGPNLGLRAGYYPLRHFGIEGELAMLPSRLETEQRAFVSTARAGAVVQLGLFRIVPFVVFGGGVISVRSEPDAAGRNGDEMLYVGGGLKYFVNEHIVLRLEGRNMMSPQEGVTPSAPAHSGEVLFGFTLALGPRKPKEEPPADFDGDGFLDNADSCPNDAGIAPDGCPARDADLDGFLDDDDECPLEAGAAPDGCPILDSDEDGYLDPDDACPEEAGVDPDGCPIRDIDGDGYLAPGDKCPEEPETFNGFEDGDGCPDEIPDVVKQYTGVVEGIFFASGKSTIRPRSFVKLDEAAKVLIDYPSLRVEVSGHTDSRGKHDKNVALSQARADAVKAYLVEMGVDAGRIETRGAGPDQPIGDNATKEGRGQNRRIEFKLVTGAAPDAASNPAVEEGTGEADAAATE